MTLLSQTPRHVNWKIRKKLEKSSEITWGLFLINQRGPSHKSARTSINKPAEKLFFGSFCCSFFSSAGLFMDRNFYPKIKQADFWMWTYLQFIFWSQAFIRGFIYGEKFNMVCDPGSKNLANHVSKNLANHLMSAKTLLHWNWQQRVVLRCVAIRATKVE